MVNEEHLAQLQQGVDAWNRWREESWEIRPDLNRAHLHGADTHRVHLTGAHLT